jgi:uncharacterized protein (TIGR02246 family)
MIRRHCFVLGLTGILLGCVGASPPENPADAEAAVEAALDAYVQAIRNNDIESLLGLWANDPVWIAAGAPTVRGRSAFDSVVRDNFRAFRVADVTASVEETAIAGDLAYQIGSYSETLVSMDGEPQTIEGRFLFIWRRQADGSWRITRGVDAGP